ncbi:hypothetical protein [Ravibacter arvi]
MEVGNRRSEIGRHCSREALRWIFIPVTGFLISGSRLLVTHF